MMRVDNRALTALLSLSFNSALTTDHEERIESKRGKREQEEGQQGTRGERREQDTNETGRETL